MTTKYMVTSGFLGSGKTTSMIAFANSINRRGLGHAAILANDLGASNIVDAEFTATTGITTLPISGNCICYQHENLVDKLHQLEDSGADIIFSDIPGCGIGALDHVYLELDDKENGQFALMPFMCIVDSERIRMIMPENADINLPEEMKFLLDAQMAEADVIVLNKIDTISPEEVQKRIDFIHTAYPDIPVMTMSALTGEGVDYDIEYSRKLDRKYSALSLVINARAAADSQDMSEIVSDALDAVSVKYDLKIRTFFMETFGMMEEGKGNTGRASRYE